MNEQFDSQFDSRKIRQSNKLINACKKFGNSKHLAVYNKIVCLAISKIVPLLPKGDPTKATKIDKELFLSYTELCDGLKDRHTFEELKEIAQTLGITRIDHYDIDGKRKKYVCYPLFKYVEYEHERGMVLQFNEHAEKDLIELFQKPYTEIYLSDMLQLKSFYAMRIYEIAKSWVYNYKNKTSFKYSLDEWKVMLDVPKDAYKVTPKPTYKAKKEYINTGELIKKVFGLPIKEINALKSKNLILSYNTLKEKNKIVAVQIIFDSESKYVQMAQTRDFFIESKKICEKLANCYI